MEEGREGVVSSSGGVTVVRSDAPSEYRIAPRPEMPIQMLGSMVGLPPSPMDSLAKKKRGRPRKYGPDGSLATPLSPKPISSAAPPVIDFSAPKRGKFKTLGSLVKHSFGAENSSGDWDACSVGANFTPHIINVNAGEDVTMKVISFSQQGPRAICVLSANGAIASVTLRQADSSGGTLTYEVMCIIGYSHYSCMALSFSLGRFSRGDPCNFLAFLSLQGRFEILSLSGSFMPSDVGGARGRSGGMSVSLAGTDGRVIGGGVAGLLVAASPVQVVVGSFLMGSQHEQKPKKPKHDNVAGVAPTNAFSITTSDTKQSISSTSPAFRADNWSIVTPDSRNKSADVNAPLP
ncbi:hypothetical protein SAY86_021966 [Trapa natans]|uniref:AT-hook motif nuclear-localized protein n=1 Tax=Trapa natans TaxID=22666 RepID=A0AAN7MAM4_TRANT|nr:hypothetical protein SAY86_021966 [Trapa natans]